MKQEPAERGEPARVEWLPSRLPGGGTPIESGSRLHLRDRIGSNGWMGLGKSRGEGRKWDG